jgi:hypothetical protein
MANVIQLKRKNTTGAPSLAALSIGEICLVLPDNAMYWKKDAATLIGPIIVASSSGDMLKSIYDTNNDGIIDVAANANQLGGSPAANYALKTYVDAAINALVNAAPGTLDTLQELATALGNDPNFASTITSTLATKLSGDSIIDGGTI